MDEFDMFDKMLKTIKEKENQQRINEGGCSHARIEVHSGHEICCICGEELGEVYCQSINAYKHYTFRRQKKEKMVTLKDLKERGKKLGMGNKELLKYNKTNKQMFIKLIEEKIYSLNK